jgi:hypothetical protein
MQARGLTFRLLPFLAVFSVSLAAFHRDSLSLDVVGSYGGGAPKDVVVAGAYAYVATEGGLLIIDVSDPPQPGWVSNHVTEEGAFRVAVAHDFACLCSDRLRLVDVSRPEAPVERGMLWVGDVTHDVVVSGDYAYVAFFRGGFSTSDMGVLVVDISNPASPREVAFMNMGRETMGVAVADGRAYVAVFGVGLKIMDVSDPEQPLELGRYAGATEAEGVAVAGDYAYVADGAAGLRVIDVSDPSAPFEVGHCEHLGTASRVRLSGPYAYVWAYEASPGFKIIDVSDPAHPYEAGRVDTQTDGMFVSSGIAYVGDNLLGLKVIDVGNPSAATQIGEYRTSGQAVAVRVRGDRGYLLDRYYDMTVLDTGDPGAPSCLGSCHTHAYASDLYVSGDRVYVTDNHNGLSIVDVADPSTPVVVGDLRLSGNPQGVRASGAYAYVAGFQNKLKVVDVSDPVLPKEVGSWAAGGAVRDLALWGNRAFLAAGNDLVILDISDPVNPSFIASSPTRSAALAVFVVDGIAYVGEDLYGLDIFDVSDVFHPSKLSSINVTRGVNDVYVSGTYAYVATGYGGIKVIDVSDPASPTKVDGYHAPGEAIKVFVDDGYAYLATVGAGLLVFRCNESKFQISGHVRESSGVPLAGVEVVLSGDSETVSTTTETGYFAFSDLPSGNYMVEPSRPGWRFTPRARYYDGLDFDSSDQDFAADVSGLVRILGGRRGYIQPAMGEAARIEIVGASSGIVAAEVYTLAGRLVWETTSSISRGIETNVVWNCMDGYGDQVGSGVYFVRIHGCGIDEAGKVVIMR